MAHLNENVASDAIPLDRRQTGEPSRTMPERVLLALASTSLIQPSLQRLQTNFVL
jgi:hypothetical protein